ncbi:MAG: hypothetical protein KDN22_10005 [Verrucomicrobiae bacterium]|nr:hypothetical protein [Verrucomicrobiae bacterium]
MSQNRLPTLEANDATSLDVDSIDSPDIHLSGSNQGFDYTDHDECDLFRLASDIARYDPALTEILVKVAIRKAELSEAG